MTTDTSPAGAQPAAIAWADAERHAAFDAWLHALPADLGLRPATLRPASADASFRRYFRVDAAARTFVVMDAPPALEDNATFVAMAAALAAGGLHVPAVHHWQREHGFLLLDDLGERTYLAELQAAGCGGTVGTDNIRHADPLYRDALGALVTLQTLPVPEALPAYDAAMVRRELDLFPEWYVRQLRGHTLDERQTAGLERAFEAITRVFTEQAQVLVHRDFHSRNLMLCAPRVAHGTVHGGAPGVGPAPNPGVLDFQGAVRGPVAYDLASLLRDAYIDWDEAQQIDWAVRHWEAARKAGVPVPDDFGSYWRDVEWTGLQRHLKVLGLFARLSIRDGKHGYLADLPRVWRNAHHVAMRYSGLTPLARLLEALEQVHVRDGYTF